MAGEAETVAAVTAEAVAEASAKAAAVTGAAVADAAATVERAEERVEAAQAVAQLVTDAAVQNAVVAKVNDAVEGIEEWEDEIEGKITALILRTEALEAMCQQLATELAELRATPPAVIMAPETEQQSILPTSEETRSAVVIAPASVPVVSTVRASPAPNGRAKTWL